MCQGIIVAHAAVWETWEICCMAARMARAVSLWAEHLKEYVRFKNSEPEEFVSSIEKALNKQPGDVEQPFNTYKTGLWPVANMYVEKDLLDTGVMQWLFVLYNNGGVPMSSELMRRETSVVRPALQMGTRVFQDASMVWAGPTLQDIRYVLEIEHQNIQDETWYRLNLYVLPEVNVVGLAFVNGLWEDKWQTTIFGLRRTDRLIKAEEEVWVQRHGCQVVCFPLSMWQAVVSCLNPSAVLICDNNGVNQRFRFRVENFIRDCKGLENVSETDFARCLAWRLQKSNGEQLFAVYENDDGKIRCAGFSELYGFDWELHSQLHRP
jgi:hypothetical protein